MAMSRQFSNYKNYRSFCIPRVDIQLDKEYICNKLNEFNIGTIITFREIPLFNDPNYKRIIMKIEWNTNINPIANNTNSTIEKIEKLIDEHGSAKLVYEMPWYWRIERTYTHTQTPTYIPQNTHTHTYIPQNNIHSSSQQTKIKSINKTNTIYNYNSNKTQKTTKSPSHTRLYSNIT